MLNQALKMKVHCTLSELEGNYSRNMMVFFFPLRVERLSHLQLVMCLSSNGYTPFFVLIMIPWSVFFLQPKTVCLGALLLSRPETH